MTFLKKLSKLFHSMGVFGLIRLTLDLIYSKILFPKARILRRPFYIRNEGKLIIGTGFSCGPGLIIDVFGENAKVEIGQNVMAYHNLHIGAIESVVIGDRVLIASGVYISDHGHGKYSGEIQSNPLVPPVERTLTGASVKIGDDVWIGERVAILPGVSIGKGVILGAGAVVTSSLPDYVIAIGVPAKVVKVFDFEKNKWMSAQI